MAVQPEIDFWFSIGSTYSYLSVMRLAAAAAHGVRFIWRPFNVREIMLAQNNRPFVGKPVKTSYMWRDIERRAALYGLSPRVPAPYPLQDMDLANRVATLGAEQGWCAAYAVATYRRWFQAGLEPGSEPNLSDSLREIGQDPERVIAAARGEHTGAQLKTATERALVMGIFGSPSFVVGDEIFWGDDRLDDAIAWARHGTLASAAGSAAN